MAQDIPEKLSLTLIFYNCQEEVETYEEIYDKELQSVNFGEKIQAEFEEYFQVTHGIHQSILAPDYRMYFGTETGPTTSRQIDVYGNERGLIKLLALAKTNGWMVLDCGLNDLIDLDFPQQYSYPDYRKMKLKE